MWFIGIIMVMVGNVLMIDVVLLMFFEFVGDLVFVVYNVGFDIGFLCVVVRWCDIIWF